MLGCYLSGVDLRQLHWLPVRQRITFKTAVLVYKCRHGTAWLRHTCRHTASQRHHTVVGVTCALPSPVNSLFHVRGQITETAVLPFTGQSCGTDFQPSSVCWTFYCQCSGNDWKCSCSRITVNCYRATADLAHLLRRRCLRRINVINNNNKIMFKRTRSLSNAICNSNL